MSGHSFSRFSESRRANIRFDQEYPDLREMELQQQNDVWTSLADICGGECRRGIGFGRRRTSTFRRRRCWRGGLVFCRPWSSPPSADHCAPGFGRLCRRLFGRSVEQLRAQLLVTGGLYGGEPSGLTLAPRRSSSPGSWRTSRGLSAMLGSVASRFWV